MAREKIAKPKKFRQNTEVTTHFHPRALARSIVHSRLQAAEVYGANKVKPGTTQSAFARNWRTEAETFAK
jgi:hypothetical protein